jgi:hypothetical protein
MVVVLVVVAVVVVTGAVVVVVGTPELDVITNPQPRAGSFNVKELEIGNCVGVVVVERGAVVVVVVVTLVDVDVDGSEVEVVVDVDGVLFVTSRPTPVNTRPSNTSRRTNRNGHRRGERVFRDAGTLRHGNSEKPQGDCEVR